MRYCLLLITLLVSLAASGRDIDAMIQHADSYVDSKPDSTVILADRLLEKYSSDMSGTQRAATVLVKSNGLFSSGDVPGALAAVTEAVKISRQARDTSMLVQALADAGVMNRVAHNPEAALKCYNEALSLVRKGGDADDEAHILISIGILFANIGRASDAVPYARDAFRKAKEGATTQTSMYVGSQAGLILFKAGQKEEGLKIERQIVDIARRENLPRYILKTYTAMLAMHKEMGRTDSVDYYISKGREIINSVPETSVESVGFMEQVFGVLSDMGRYRESLEVQHRLLAMKDAAMYIPLAKLWKSIGANYARLGDVSHASEAYERSIEIADSIRSTEIDAQLSEFDSRYGAMKKEMVISKLQEEKSRMRMWTVIWVSLTVLLLGAVLAWMAVSRRREAMVRIRENLRGVEQERARLASELHDGVCNDLYGISLLLGAGQCNTADAVSEIGRVSSEVRHISHELMPPSLEATDLAELLSDMTARSWGFIVSGSDLSSAEGIGGETGYQIYRMVQELAGNIRKHTDSSGIKLSVARPAHDKLVVTLEYVGNILSDNCDAAGIGTRTIRRRLELTGAVLTESKDGSEHVATITVNIVK